MASFSRSNSVGSRTNLADRRPVAVSGCDEGLVCNTASFSRNLSIGSRTILFDRRLCTSDCEAVLGDSFSLLDDVLGVGGLKSKERPADDDDDFDERDFGLRFRVEELEVPLDFRFLLFFLTGRVSYSSSSSDQSP